MAKRAANAEGGFSQGGGILNRLNGIPCESGPTCTVTRLELDVLRGAATQDELDALNDADGNALFFAPLPPIFQGAKIAIQGVLALRRAQAIRRLAAASSKIDTAVIWEIKALPDGARLTINQAANLSRNIDALLKDSLAGKLVSQSKRSGGAADLIRVFKTDRRFRFLDQVFGEGGNV